MKTKAIPRDEPLLRVISLGAGVQSTTMALLAAHGVIGPMPDYAIFSDTHGEPSAVYDHLRWLGSGNVLPFPVITIDGGDLASDLKAGRDQLRDMGFASIPYHIRNPDGSTGIGRRGCTKRYKIEPLAAEHKRLLGVAKGKNVRPNSVEVWIGVSLDETYRVRESDAKWQTNRWPLVELRMTRRDCERWLESNGYPVPTRSACAFCPYHSDREWLRLRTDEPEAWQQAVELDELLRANKARLSLRGTPYLQKTCRPLREVDLDPHARQPDLFNNECAGLCGV